PRGIQPSLETAPSMHVPRFYRTTSTERCPAGLFLALEPWHGHPGTVQIVSASRSSLEYQWSGDSTRLPPRARRGWRNRVRRAHTERFPPAPDRFCGPCASWPTAFRLSRSSLSSPVLVFTHLSASS